MRLVALSGVLLAGCAHHPLDCAAGFYHEDCLPGTRAYEQQRQRAEQDALRDEATCKSYGLAYGTEQYVSCRMNLTNQRAASARAAAIVAADATQFGRAAAPDPVYKPSDAQPPVSQTATHGLVASLVSFRVTTRVTGQMAWVCEYRFGTLPFEVTLDHQCPPTREVQ
jgi:hypothetical protein